MFQIYLGHQKNLVLYLYYKGLRILLLYYLGMSHLNQAVGTHLTCCLTASNNTSYHADNDLILRSSTSHGYRQDPGDTSYWQQNTRFFYKATGGGSDVRRTTTNLTSYSAGASLFVRIFIKVTTGSATYYVVHTDSNYLLTIREIEI